MRGVRLRRALAAAALTVPLALTGCTPPWAQPAAEPAAAAGQTAGADPAGAADSWIVVTRGNRTGPTPTPAAAARPTRSAAAARPAVPAAATEPTQPPCTGGQGQGQVQGLTVLPGAGSADVTWYHPGGPDVVSYRLTAVPQRLVSGAQPELRWQPVTPDAGCRMITSTVRGLVRGAPYVFWLDAVRTARQGDGTRSVTAGRSTVVYAR